MRENASESINTVVVEILRALIKEWGREEVERALDQLSQVRGRRRTRAVPKSGRSKKLSPIQRAAKAKISRGRRPLVRALAERFEFKEFLPRTADVRNFLIMHGQTAHAIKDRDTSFQLVLKLLAKLPEEALEAIVSERKYSGPSSLGPLSDAIEEVGPRVRPGSVIGE